MPTPAKHCLLVVDDEPDLVQSVQDLLRFDFRVLGATRAAEGLKLMKAEKVHIVMTDQRMPEMTGVEFLRALRENFPDTVRLLFTAYADLDAVTDAINTGNVYRYIAKPWEPQELKGVLKQAVEYYDLNAERKRLLREVQDKNKQLEEANAELRQANELKRAFIRVASHELRTPLTIVMGLSELAQRHRGLSEPLQAWIERIHPAGGRLNGRVDRMVKLLLAERFERPLPPKPVELPQLLNAAADEVDSFVAQRRQKLVRVIPGDLGIIQAEEDKLYDSLVQLLVNAIKFTPDGGTITLSGRRHEGNGVAIVVHDTGVGIEPASAARLFDPFFTKFDVSRHCSGVFEFDRRGLGLTVVKAFVEMQGGRVHVDSEVGKGSTFTLTLPSQPPVRDAATGAGL